MEIWKWPSQGLRTKRDSKQHVLGLLGEKDGIDATKVYSSANIWVSILKRKDSVPLALTGDELLIRIIYVELEDLFWIVTDLVMSDSEHSTVSYTSISSDSDPSAWGIPLMDAGELPEMDHFEEVAQQGQTTPLSPAYVSDPMELEHHVPVYVPEPVYLVYLEDADEEEEEHLASSNSTTLPAIDHVPLAERTLIAAATEALIVLVAAIQPSSSFLPSLLTPLSSPLPQIPSLPLPLPSPPTHTSPTYVEAPLGYRAVRIRMRATSPLPLHAPSTSRIANIPEADIPPRKRLLLTAPTPRFEVGKSSAAAAARQPGSTVARRVDYSFVDTVDASIRAFERRTMAAIEVVNLRVSYQADVCRWGSEKFYTRHQDTQGDHAALRDEVDTLRMYLSSLCTTYEQERVKARQALDRSEAHNRALEAWIAVLET
ncbi:hypothetical protein Tco_0632631 [Tanacetum coccineum]